MCLFKKKMNRALTREILQTRRNFSSALYFKFAAKREREGGRLYNILVYVCVKIFLRHTCSLYTLIGFLFCR